MDVSSLSNNGQLLLFSGGAISYGLMSEVSVYSRDFTWLGDRRLDVAQLRAVIYNRYMYVRTLINYEISNLDNYMSM